MTRVSRTSGPDPPMRGTEPFFLETNLLSGKFHPCFGERSQVCVCGLRRNGNVFTPMFLMRPRNIPAGINLLRPQKKYVSKQLYFVSNQRKRQRGGKRRRRSAGHCKDATLFRRAPPDGPLRGATGVKSRLGVTRSDCADAFSADCRADLWGEVPLARTGRRRSRRLLR